jgi:hypothetical protein
MLKVMCQAAGFHVRVHRTQTPKIFNREFEHKVLAIVQCDRELLAFGIKLELDIARCSRASTIVRVRDHESRSISIAVARSHDVSARPFADASFKASWKTAWSLHACTTRSCSSCSSTRSRAMRVGR